MSKEEKQIVPTSTAKMAKIEQDLINGTFKNASEVKEEDVPDKPGLYCIRPIGETLSKPFDDGLAKEFANQISELKHNILYIGKASKSLKKRCFEQELKSHGPATFFQSIGAALGFLPLKGFLKGKKNQKNFCFNDKDKGEIIKWIGKNLQVNWMELPKGEIHSSEKFLIEKYKPLLNYQDNPQKSSKLIDLKNKCRQIARGK